MKIVIARGISTRCAAFSTSNVPPSHDASTEEDSQDVMALDLGGTRTNDITTPYGGAWIEFQKFVGTLAKPSVARLWRFEGSPEDGTNSLSQPLTFKVQETQD